MELIGVSLAAAIGSLAWLYQRAWERQERRIARYQEVLDRLPAFTEANADPAKMNEAIGVIRGLWLSAPDDVVVAAEKFLDTAEGTDPDPEQKNLGACDLPLSFSSTRS